MASFENDNSVVDLCKGQKDGLKIPVSSVRPVISIVFMITLPYRTPAPTVSAGLTSLIASVN